MKKTEAMNLIAEVTKDNEALATRWWDMSEAEREDWYHNLSMGWWSIERMITTLT